MTQPERPTDPPTTPGFSHLDQRGQARMVDVSGKAQTARVARARGLVKLPDDVLKALVDGELPKGEGLGVARLAGIQAAKETSRLIPLCHALALASVRVDLLPVAGGIEIRSEVKCVGPTGVEMEALCAVSGAALTLYDMCKARSRGIRIEAIELVHKSGGRSGTWDRPEPPPAATEAPASDGEAAT